MVTNALTICSFFCMIPCCLSEEFLGDLEKEDVRAVRRRLEEEKEKRLLLENDVEVLLLKVGQLERLVTDMRKGEVCNTIPPKTIAFHASYSKSHLQLASGNTMIFDNVLLNVGGAYSPITGVFRTYTPGTYVFSLQLLTYTGTDLHIGIYKNDVMIGRAYANPTGSKTVVISLEASDEVYVRTYKKGGAHGDHYCAFSGFLLR